MSIVEVGLSGAAIIFGVATIIYRKARGLPIRFRRKAKSKPSDDE
ncbi:hypothetical protein ABIB25_002081 [Nakamurella sp. UYEF19]